MMRSMFAGVSGLRTHQFMMDVVGNNIANVNTAGYKASRVVFQDTLSQLVGAGSGSGDSTTGSVNPQQVGLGVKIGATDLLFNQGASQLTGRVTDVAVQGEGFFVVHQNGEQLYTRAGSFTFDNKGMLASPSGAVVQGWMANLSTGKIDTTVPVRDIQVDLNSVFPPQPTQNVVMAGNLDSSSAAAATTQTSIDIVDGVGQKHTIRFQYTKGTNPNEWDAEAFDGTTSLGTTTLTFDGTGKLPAGTTLSITGYDPGNGADPMDFNVDFSAVTQFGQPNSPLALSQDGLEPGSLRSMAIGDDGLVTGVFSNGQTKTLAKLSLATFANPGGLIKMGFTNFRATDGSGTPVIGVPGQNGRGTLASGTLEMSNVDLAQEFTNLIIAQRGFQANSRIISASDEILQDLVNLKR